MEDSFERKVALYLQHPDVSLAIADPPGDCKLPEFWDRAGAAHVKLANCHLKCDRKLEASRAYANAARCYKITNINECISCFEHALNMVWEVGRLNVASRYCKQLAELHESECNIEQSTYFYEAAASVYPDVDITCAVECKQKVARLAATKLKQYPKAIEMYEHIANQSLKSYKLKHEVQKHLLEAGLCHLLTAGVVEAISASNRYKKLDPTFSGTAEYKLLLDIAAAIEKNDIKKFFDANLEFIRENKAPPGEWTMCLLGRVNTEMMLGMNDREIESWKAKEFEVKEWLAAEMEILSARMRNVPDTQLIAENAKLKREEKEEEAMLLNKRIVNNRV